MDNISKYPKDWYKQLTRKKKPKQEEASERPKNDKRRSSNQSDKAGKEAKDKQESSNNGDGAEAGGKSDEDKDAIPEWRNSASFINYKSAMDKLILFYNAT